MSAYLRIWLGAVVILYFCLVMHFVKRKMLALKYTLLWLLCGLLMGILVLFPELLVVFVEIAGIETPIYGLFVSGIFFSLVTGMSLTAIVSRQAEEIKALAQEHAMMEKRIRELEGSMEERGRYESGDHHIPGDK